VDTDSDLILTCRQCGREFIFTKAEQEFYQQKGFTQPLHCKQCRSNRRNAPLVCSGCGGQLGRGTPVYCAACQSAASVGAELEARRLKGTLAEVSARLSAAETEKAQLADTVNAKLAASEAEKALMVNEFSSKLNEAESDRVRLTQDTNARLEVAESEKAELAALLREKERLSAELQEQLNTVRLELEKALKYRATLDWLEPAFKIMKESLSALEGAQGSLNQSILKLTERLEANGHGGQPGMLRRFFRPHWKSSSPGDNIGR
jgi:hypothetical protein